MYLASPRQEEKIQSKSNIDALAGYGVDMDHPCVRVFTKEEVDTNRSFLAVSAGTWAHLGNLKVCSSPVSTAPHLTFPCRERHRRSYRGAR